MLKEKLTYAPILTIPKGTKCVFVYCVASQVVFGCVLMQQGKIIAYASKKHKFHEKNYPNHDHDIVALVFALKI